MLDDDKQATAFIGILRGGRTCGSDIFKEYQETTTEWTKVSLFLTWIKEVMQHKGRSFILFRKILHQLLYIRNIVLNVFSQ